MSFDRPGLPHPGHKADEVEIDESLQAEGLELTSDGDLDGLDHPGEVSAGPQPNPARRPHEASTEASTEATEATTAATGQAVDETGEPVDDPAHDDPSRDTTH